MRGYGRREMQTMLGMICLMLASFCLQTVAHADDAAAQPAPAAEAAPAEAAPAEAAPMEASAEAPDAAAETPAPGEGDVGAKKFNWIEGSFRAGVDAEWSSRDSDLDFDQHLRLRLRHPDHPNTSVVGSLWMHENTSSNDYSSALNDIYDAYDGDVQARLYDLYVQQEKLWGNTTLRFGRQRISDGPWYNRIDGLYLRQYYQQWDWYAFVGARASVYEDAHDDLVTGGGINYHLSHRTTVGVDVMYADDHRRLSRAQNTFNPLAAIWNPGYPRRVNEEVSNTQIAFHVAHDFNPNLRVYGQFILNDGDGDELLLDLTGYYAAWDLTYEVSYRHQLQRIGDRSNDFTSFYRVLGPENEYGNLLVSLHKPLCEKLILSLEGELHDAKNDDWLTGNRDYWRLAAILSAQEVLWGMNASVGLERWNVQDGEGAWAVTGELRKQYEHLEWFLGADFERYRDDLVEYNRWPSFLYQFSLLAIPGSFSRFTPGVWYLDSARVETHENIYTLYTGIKYDLKENQTLRGRVSFEDDDSSDSPYWRVQASYEIKF